ncbi:hypothetical protein FA048_03275 [Pedobacter polaris]|uniref:Lipoprotein n=1 Tax=Pedobacter polaris TaxID=2571273 RepID=A0A4U1CV18_9SPHI|nr:hypothetical protein [Pedobacter polaris]TKC12653.1 hypothetical protein FA048_03275 [Pedobacter polaris]
MKKLYFILFILLTGFSACKDDTPNFDTDPNCEDCVEVAKLSKADGQAYLAIKYNEITSIANGVVCTNAANWKIIAIGSKACGGPTGFIAYEKSINEAAFLKKVKDYTAAQVVFNKKWGIFSTCEIPIEPSGVECVDGKVKFIK